MDGVPAAQPTVADSKPLLIDWNETTDQSEAEDGVEEIEKRLRSTLDALPLARKQVNDLRRENQNLHDRLAVHVHSIVLVLTRQPEIINSK